VVFTIKKKRWRHIELRISDFSNLFFVRFLLDLLKNKSIPRVVYIEFPIIGFHIQTANRRSANCERLRCKFNYLGIIPIPDEPLLRFSINFSVFPSFHKKSIFPTVRILNQNTSEIILEKSVICSSMRLHLLFSMVKITVLYLVAIKRYSKSTYEHSCYQSICETNRSYLLFYY
jgi:hypothetical protein